MVRNYVRFSTESIVDGKAVRDSATFFFTPQTARSTATALAEVEACVDVTHVTPKLAIYAHDPAFPGVPCIGGCFICDPGHDERREESESESEDESA